MTVTSITTTSRTAYIRDNASVERLVESVQPGETFFRMEKVTRKTKNDGAWMHFPSVSLFSSTANADLSALFKKLGCESSTNAYSITGSTPLIDSLLSVRYGIYSEQPMTSRLREFLSSDEDTYLYENKYTLPLGFLVDGDFESRWDLQLGQPADVQNSLADAVDASQVLILNTDIAADGKKLTFTPSEDGEYYAYVSNKKIEKVTATTPDGTKTFNNVDRGFLLELGYCPADQEITLTTDSGENMQAEIYRFSEDGLISVYEALNEHPWKMTKWENDELVGTIDCPSGGVLFTSIPYDEGWTVLVDGEEQPAEKMLDAFISIQLNPGSHTVEMHYMPKGLRPGALISAASLILLILAAVAEHVLAAKLAAWEEAEPEDDPVEEELEELLQEDADEDPDSN
jgi:uncharacterized membrane protein YfhO